MAEKKVLVVLTSTGTVPGTDHRTGWYLPELAHPYEVLTANNISVTVASPKGGVAPLDPASVELFKEDASCVDFKEKHSSVWSDTTPISTFLGKTESYAALFFPGGHGPMFDLATDSDSQALIREFLAAGKPVAAVCHGPAALVNVKLESGEALVKGKKVTALTNAEEDKVGMTKLMPFLLETALVEAGADFVKANEVFGEKVVVDGQLITGQNPASSKAIGGAIAQAIGQLL